MIADAEPSAVRKRGGRVVDWSDIGRVVAGAPSFITPGQAARPAPLGAAILLDQTLGTRDVDRRVDPSRCLRIEQRLLQWPGSLIEFDQPRSVDAEAEIADARVADLIVEAKIDPAHCPRVEVGIIIDHLD